MEGPDPAYRMLPSPVRVEFQYQVINLSRRKGDLVQKNRGPALGTGDDSGGGQGDPRRKSFPILLQAEEIGRGVSRLPAKNGRRDEGQILLAGKAVGNLFSGRVEIQDRPLIGHEADSEFGLSRGEDERNQGKSETEFQEIHELVLKSFWILNRTGARLESWNREINPLDSIKTRLADGGSLRSGQGAEVNLFIPINYF
jgi:hypothetical protein